MRASLNIQTENRNGRSVISKCFFNPPFKVADITEDKSGSTLHLMLMNSSPGVLCGDAYEMKINIGERTSLQLYTQSYQRLFSMKNSAAQKMDVRLGDHATFTFLPHPVVPHNLSNFRSENKIFLSENCKLTWAEIFTCGRKMNGEIFQFSKYHSTTEIYLHNKLVMKENLFMQPATCNVAGMGLLEGFTHQASFIYLDENADEETIKKLLSDILCDEKEIEFGISSAPIKGLVVRILGQRSEQLFNCLNKMANAIALLSTPKKLKVHEH